MTRFLTTLFLICLLALPGCSLPGTGGVRSVPLQERAPGLTGEPPAISPPAQPLSEATLFSWADLSEADLGVGFLAPASTPADASQWTRQMALPLFDEPDGQQSGWLVNGWVKKTDAENPVPLTALGMVEAAPDLLAFIVLARDRAGWIRFRYDKPEPQNDGTAWTHENHLALGGTALQLRLWQTELLKPQYAPLFFRNPKASHALREAPALNGRLITWIGRSHDLEPLEARGDWMKVRVTQPSVRCRPDRSVKTRTHEGWTRVRHPESGLWIWYHTEPCP